jgi:hypothetical protein
MMIEIHYNTSMMLEIHYNTSLMLEIHNNTSLMLEMHYNTSFMPSPVQYKAQNVFNTSLYSLVDALNARNVLSLLKIRDSLG